MWFCENGRCEFEMTADGEVDVYGRYTGTYAVSADEARPGIVTFELVWWWADGVDDSNRAIVKGCYFPEMAAEGVVLYRFDGECLYEPMEEYRFVTGAMG